MTLKWIVDNIKQEVAADRVVGSGKLAWQLYEEDDPALRGFGDRCDGCKGQPTSTIDIWWWLRLQARLWWRCPSVGAPIGGRVRIDGERNRIASGLYQWHHQKHFAVCKMTYSTRSGGANRRILVSGPHCRMASQQLPVPDTNRTLPRDLRTSIA